MTDDQIMAIINERDGLRAELAAIKARVHEAYLRDPVEGNTHAETGDSLLDRLRGIYTIPVNDGAGLLNGKDTFTRRFPALPINVEAAAEIDRLRDIVRGLVAINTGLRCDEILDESGDDV